MKLLIDTRYLGIWWRGPFSWLEIAFGPRQVFSLHLGIHGRKWYRSAKIERWGS